MPSGKVVINVLDVGQGQCTFVEVYDSKSQLLHTLLFDAGTTSSKTRAQTTTNITYVANKIKARVKSDGTANEGLDAIFFSHSDLDHVNLMADILKLTGKSIKVENVWYSGPQSRYEKYGTNIIDELESDFGIKAKAPNPNYSSYTKGSSYGKAEWEQTVDGDKVSVYVLMANALTTKTALSKYDGWKAESLNRVSMICGLYFQGISVVICGDATNETMSETNKKFKSATKIFDANIMTTMPHHGSRKTGFGLSSSDAVAKDAQIQVVQTFGTTLKSQSISVSAFNDHSHPSLDMMYYLDPNTVTIVQDSRLSSDETHMLLAFVDFGLYAPVSGDLPFQEYLTFGTDVNIYATWYFQPKQSILPPSPPKKKAKKMSKPSPNDDFFQYNFNGSNTSKFTGFGSSVPALNEHACWVYEIENRKFSMDGKPDMASAVFTEDADSSVTTKSQPMIEANVPYRPLFEPFDRHGQAMPNPIQRKLQSFI